MAEFKPIRLLVNHAVSPRRFFMLLVVAFAALGAASGRARHLRRHLVLRHAADAGDRHPHGAGRERGTRAAAGACRDACGLRSSALCWARLRRLRCARLIASLLFATSPWDAVDLYQHGGWFACGGSESAGTSRHSGHRASTRRWLCAPTERSRISSMRRSSKTKLWRQDRRRMHHAHYRLVAIFFWLCPMTSSTECGRSNHVPDPNHP